MPGQTPHTHIAFPLDSFIERLEIAGFRVSTRQRLQLWRVLQDFGPATLAQPDQLKYRLCPIIAADAGEQDRFYQLFDRYLEQIRTYQTPEEELDTPSHWTRLPIWTWALIVAALLTALGLALRGWIVRPEPPQLRMEVRQNPIVLGDTLRVFNRSTGYDSTAFRWELRDAGSGNLEQSVQGAFDWQTPVTELGDSPDKEIWLIGQQDDRRDTLRQPLRLRCADFPAYTEVSAREVAATAATEYNFRPREPEQPDLRYTWDFGDGDRAEGYRVRHRYTQPGGYTVRLEISRPGAEGYCRQVLSEELSVGEQRVFLAWLSMERDRPAPAYFFGRGAWLLLLLLLLPAIWFWYRWLRQKAPTPDPERRAQALAQRYAHADRPPYGIPFRNRDALLPAGRPLYRMARVLRLRQEGLRSELDVPATIRETIERAGFPAVRYRRTTVPPNYLFLIDEQAPDSHQTQLYRYLVDFLRGQDVLLEVFWYRGAPDPCWNARHPRGLSLAQVQRLYPDYRLVLVGEGQALLDPMATERHAIRPGLARTLGRWKSHLLLTPRPAAEWTYREAALYGLFPIFPGDTEGIQAAMAHLEYEMEEEDLKARPGFGAWRQQMERSQVTPPGGYRNWNRLESYEAFFAGQPALFRWFCALLVFPEATWPLTLAIGRAIGAPVTFDHLQRLAQVPYLQGASLSPRLRRQLLDRLDPATEARARAAVAAELEAVAPATRGSHADRKLQTQLSLQQFLIDPDHPGHRAELQYLLDRKALSRRDRKALEEAYARQHPDRPPLEAQLQKEDGKPAPAGLRLNADFYRALGMSLLVALLGLLLGGLNGSERLATWLGDPEAAPGPLLDRRVEADSALYYHNRAVAQWDSLRNSGQQILPADLDPIDADLERAIQLRRGNYPQAELNRARTAYHLGVLHYQNYLQTRGAEPRLRAAEAFGAAVAEGQILPDARHAQGLLQFYERDRPAAEDIFYELQGRGYFDTLRLDPNLRTLLFPAVGGAVLAPDCLAPPEASREGAGTLCPGDTLRLQVGTSNDEATSYLIRWGDGRTDSLTQPGARQHVYAGPPSEYRVQVLAFGDCPEVGQAYNRSTLTVAVGAAPRADFTPSVLQGCAPLEVQFSPAETGEARHRWDFGNGQSSEEARPTITYTRPGAYLVRLEITTPCGTAIQSRRITVLDEAQCRTVFDLEGRVVAGDGGGVAGAGITGTAEGWSRLQPRTPVLRNLRTSERSVAEEPQDTESAQPPQFQARTDADGYFRLQEVPIGVQLSLQVQAPDYRTLDTTITTASAMAPLLLRMPSLPEVDTDKDGIIDDEDRCPEEPGPATTQGCPDTDEDGIPDRDDDCPEQPGTLANQGCPDPQQVPGKVVAVAPDMVAVAGGTFQMGDVLGDKEQDDERVHTVTVSDFRIGRYEVTFQEYDVFCEATGRELPADEGWGRGRRPVINVSWEDAVAYCNWLSEQLGYAPVYRIEGESVSADFSKNGFRLPTEAEWEYAARQRGQEVRFGNGQNVARAAEINFDASEDYKKPYSESGVYRGQTVPVGSLNSPNALGLHDMSGNVLEWCWDWYDAAYYRQSDGATDPRGPDSGLNRVVRGGGWYGHPQICRAADRDGWNPAAGNSFLGFRLARSSK